MARSVDDLEGDPIVKALERSAIAQTLKAARASLAQPSRPFTPLDRSLFQVSDPADSSRPNTGACEQISFTRDVYGGRPGSARSSRSSRSFQETIPEEYGRGYHPQHGADVLRLDASGRGASSASLGGRPSPHGSESPGSSDDEQLSPVLMSSGSIPLPRGSPNARPPRPPGGGYPAGAATAQALRSGGYPDAASAPELARYGDASPQRPHKEQSPRRKAADGSPRRKKKHSSRSPHRHLVGGDSGVAEGDWDALCEAVVLKLQSLAESEDKKKQSAILFLEISDRVWNLVVDIQAGKSSKTQKHASMLLRAVLGLMDLKDAKCLFRLSRCALALLQIDGAVSGVHSSGVQAAYLNIAKALFKCSKSEGHDADFLSEGLLAPLLEVLTSSSPECTSNDLRVYIVGVLKNVSHDESNQKALTQQGSVDALFSLMASEQLTGNSKEAQLLIQITAALRNLSGSSYKMFLHEDRLNAMTRIMALFPGNVELLTNISRILAKLTLHGSACEAYSRSDAHIQQITRTLGSGIDSAPLVLRLAFILGNFTAKSDRLRIVFAFDCEGTALAPQLMGKFWRQDRQLARIEVEKGQGKAQGLQEVEDVLVKVVRLIANIAISSSAGATLASSSAVVDPLLDMLGSKRIADSEELVLNVVAAITNLLFYDVPSNLLFQDDNKKLLCRLFRPLLLESYNVEALVETARALGNLSRHADARRSISELRLDEILVILLDHDDRDLVFYVCGALVNLAADSECTTRLTSVCPLIPKLRKLLGDAPADDIDLQLVAVKVLTNLSLDPSVEWAPSEITATAVMLEDLLADSEAAEAADDPEGQQMRELAKTLLSRLPAQEVCPPADDSGQRPGREFVCTVAGCSRRFETEAKLSSHMERRHGGQG